MIEAVMLWNEPNNLSHWDFKVDPDWKIFAEMVITASRAIRPHHPTGGRGVALAQLGQYTVRRVGVEAGGIGTEALVVVLEDALQLRDLFR